MAPKEPKSRLNDELGVYPVDPETGKLTFPDDMDEARASQIERNIAANRRFFATGDKSALIEEGLVPDPTE